MTSLESLRDSIIDNAFEAGTLNGVLAKRLIRRIITLTKQRAISSSHAVPPDGGTGAPYFLPRLVGPDLSTGQIVVKDGMEWVVLFDDDVARPDKASFDFAVSRVSKPNP